MQRIAIVANKSWEADPLIAVLASPRSRPARLAFGGMQTGTRGLRGVADAGGRAVEVWCLEDLLASADASRSDRKAAALAQLLDPANGDFALVVAFGTAASPGDVSQNGCVAIGTNVFVHDARPTPPVSTWPPPRADTLLASLLDPAVFQNAFVSDAYGTAVEKLMLTVPLFPAAAVRLRADAALTALSSVNMTDPAQYDAGDAATMAAYAASGATAPIGSIETTHGVIRSCTTAPFLFVSGIVNRMGQFLNENKPRAYAQNFVGANNAAVALATALPALANAL